MKAQFENLYQEMLVMRDQLLNRIELLESDVELLTKENMDYAKQMYELENYLEDRIDIILEHITNLNNSEGSTSSKETNQTI
jgi:hypothetical protein|tara:strand:+ start:118 stop:363 length:246 start_codon:yes stop_codon:yes gene_type:complete